MSASADLYSLLNAQNNLRYYEQQLLVLTSRYDANLELLQDQQKYETKYWDAIDAWNDRGDKDLKDAKGVKWYTKATDKKAEWTKSGATAEAYAQAKVTKYDEELLEMLTDKDVQFDTLQTTFKAMVDQLNGEVDALKENTSTECQKTHLLGGS